MGATAARHMQSAKRPNQVSINNAELSHCPMSEDDAWTDDGRAGDLTTDSDSYFGGGDGDLTTDSDADDLFTESDSDEEGGGRSKRCATLDTSRYLLVRKVGVGTTATALLCLDLVEANRPVILKNTQKSRFRSLPNPSSTELSRHPLGYLGEIAVLKKLESPNIIRLFNVVDHPDAPTVSLVLEYAPGGDLRTYIGRGHLDTDGKPRPGIDPERMWSWSRDVVNGMAYMHRAGVIHRDIKPENVLIGVDSSAKIGDFGSAVIVDPGRHGSDVMTDQVGSPAYMSPECAGGDPYHGFRSDIYSLGTTLYHCLFGRVPHEAPNAAMLFEMVASAGEVDLMPRGRALDPALTSLLRKCLARDPHRRATARQLLEDEWLTDEGRSTMTVWRKLPSLGAKLSRRDLANAVQQTDSGKLTRRGGGNADDSSEPADSLHDIVSSSGEERETRTIKQGELLFMQGDEATEAYYIQEGTAEIFVERSIDLPGPCKVAGKKKTRDVGPGDLLGEVDLFLDGNVRTASVAALSDMRVMVIQRSEISDWFAKEPKAATAAKEKANDFRQLRKQMSGQLRTELQIKLGMGIDSFPSINEDLPERRYRAGSIIFSAGEDAAMVWWVRKGEVKELHVAKGQTLDDAIVIKEWRQGDFIGYATFMLDRTKRLVTAVAKTQVELVGISKSLFLQLVCSNPELEVKLRAHAKKIVEETESFIAKRLREVAQMVIAAQRMSKLGKSSNLRLDYRVVGLDPATAEHDSGRALSDWASSLGRLSERNEDASQSASSSAGTEIGTDDE